MPYEQGALFLTFLEAKFGREAFDAFLRRWFDEHAFKSVTTEDSSFLRSIVARPSRPDAVTDAQIEEWLHSETVPAFAVLPQSDAFTKVEQLRDAWLAGGAIERWPRRARPGPPRNGFTSSTRCHGR